MPLRRRRRFTYERFTEVYNAALADNLGNLYSRTLSMGVNYFDGG